MEKEIERKFLVCGEFRTEASGSCRIEQGYLCIVPERTVRVRIAGEQGYITIKGPSDLSGRSRYEFEAGIPLADAQRMMKLCIGNVLTKERFMVPFRGHVWEVDLFSGANQGLILAEVELSEEDEPVDIPPWVGKEVTGDERFYNSYLASCPFRDWEEEEQSAHGDENIQLSNKNRPKAV